MMQPPMTVIRAVERFAPGFWGQWSGAVAAAWRSAPGMRVTSWWRDPRHNREVGGSDSSQHLLGVAFDVVPVTSGNYYALQRAGFRVVNEGDHLHAQPWPPGSARPILRTLGW